MKKAWPRKFAVLWLAFAAAAVCGSAFGQSPSDEQKRRLIEQKIKLVETLANSPAANSSAAGSDAETPKLVAAAKRSIEAARAALGETRLDDAAKLVDEALKAVSTASRRMSAGAPLSDSALRKSLADLTEQVATYRGALVDLGKDAKQSAAAQEALSRLDPLIAQAKQFDAAGRPGEANRKMAEAYKLAVDEISRLRQGQEVVLSLNFDSPADEYAYEQKRFHSNEVMVDMMITDGKADGDRRALVDRFVTEARRLKREAEGEANADRYKEAIAGMEKATGQLVRALQLMGVPVF
jgi:hypothetical protein